MTTAHRYHLLDVFTDVVFGGNPLAVFPDARNVPPALMPSIARELNLSETVFVLPPTDPDATHHTRIFTPASELPFAGHPTVGTACLLAALREVPLRDGEGSLVFQQGAGNVAVRVRAPGGPGSWFAQLTVTRPLEVRGAEVGREPLAGLLGLRPDDVRDDDLAPVAASLGGPFLFVPLRDREAVNRCRLDLAAWHRALGTAWAASVFVFAEDAERPGSVVRARMFAPRLGILEDPATGSAAAALAALLGARAGGDGTFRWRVEQGFEMGRASILDIEADVVDGRITAVRVGGGAVVVGEGVLHLPG